MRFLNRLEVFGEITIKGNYALCSNYPNYIFYKDGKVFNIRKERFLKESKTINSYIYYTIRNNKKEKLIIYAHRLMFLIFIENIPFGMEVNHINHCRTDNHIMNLEVLTVEDNRKLRRKKVDMTEFNYSELDKKHNDKYKNYYKNYNLKKKSNKDIQ